jgi:hypothetical protein
MAKRIQLTNLTRDVLMIPVEAGMPRGAEQLLIIGDKIDTDDQVPEGQKRDPKYQPKPVWVGTEEQYNSFGEWACSIIEELISMGRLGRVELA